MLVLDLVRQPNGERNHGGHGQQPGENHEARTHRRHDRLDEERSRGRGGRGQGDCAERLPTAPGVEPPDPEEQQRKPRNQGQARLGDRPGPWVVHADRAALVVDRPRGELPRLDEIRLVYPACREPLELIVGQSDRRRDGRPDQDRIWWGAAVYRRLLVFRIVPGRKLDQLLAIQVDDPHPGSDAVTGSLAVLRYFGHDQPAVGDAKAQARLVRSEQHHEQADAKREGGDGAGYPGVRARVHWYRR